MSFSSTMIAMLKANPTLRREMFTAKAAAGGIKAGLKPTPQAKKIVAQLEHQEKAILNSKEYKTAFDQTVKPEMRPYKAMEDVYNKGYLQDKAFWRGEHKYYSSALKDINSSTDYWSPSEIRYSLKGLYSANRNSEIIREMKNLRTIQGEVNGAIDRSKLKINLNV